MKEVKDDKKEFSTAAVVSTATGRLFGSIDGVYEVMSWMLDRPAFTHELAYYAKDAASRLYAAVPHLPSRDSVSHVNRENWQDVLAEIEGRLGKSFFLPASLKGCMADSQNAGSTLDAMLKSRSEVSS